MEVEKIYDPLYNTLQFSPGKVESKSVVTQGAVCVDIFMGGLLLTATDGYIFIQEVIQLDYSGYEGEEFWITGENLKLAEGLLRGEKGSIDLLFTFSPATPNPAEVTFSEATLTIPAELEPPGGDLAARFWAGARELFETYPEPASTGPVAVSPDRLGRLSRLRPKGKYPLDILDGVTSAGLHLWFMKYGPTRLVLSPLDREILEENFSDMKGVLW